jgi:NitT/TauT family transport system substrate-binding protein
MMRLRKRVLLCVLVFVVALATAIPGGAQAPSGTKVTIGQSFVSPAAAAFWVARDQKLFTKYGLDVTIVLFRGSTPAIQALLAGENQVMLGAPSQGMTANAAGADLISIATTGPKMPYLLITRPDIKSPADLKGRRVGASSTGLSADRTAMLIALKHLKLDPKRDNITFIVTGTQSERVQALAAGTIDAFMNDPLQRAIAERLGMKVLMDLSTLDIPWDHDVVRLQRQYAKSNPGVVEALLKAYLEASAFILNPANKKAVTSSLAKDMKLDKEELIELAYNLTLSLYVVKKPYPSMKAARALVEAVQADFPQFAKVNLETHIDPSFMEKLDKSGFIDQLYQTKK